MAVLTLKNKEFATFPQILREYAAHETVVAGKSEKTVCEYLLDLRTFFRWRKATALDLPLDEESLMKIGIKDLTVEDVASVTSIEIINFLMFAGLDRENNPTTRMRKLSSLRSFYHYICGKKHIIKDNPTSDIEGPKKSRTLPKFLTQEEAFHLLETVNADTDSKTRVRDTCMIAMFLNTGMRLSELVGLNVQSFDSDLTSVKVLGKGNKERIIYLNDGIRSILVSYLDERLDPKHVRTDSPALFLSGRDKRISSKTVQWVVYKYLDLAGLGNRGLSVHKLRHTAATLMFQSGDVDIRVLKDILGHEQLNTTQIYTHVVDQNIREAMDSNPLANFKIK